MEMAMDPGIEAQIGEWRSYLLRRRTIGQVDVDELEDHLRNEISELGAVGLSGDESFLVAIKRIGGVNDLSREFARERSSRLWKQLVLGSDTARERAGSEYAGLIVTLCFALGAALAFKLPAAFGINPFGAEASDSANLDPETSFYLRNAALLTLP
ncbi:MAG TPA: permease prefix domain 1-containing protein, partial [Dehalococcoidia bacterium]|nr:permease prefix domain 1-containing protein [Dehalococcoidia bacterium]